ncbi:hypothetical protein PYCC9005_002751 [Savitreella phatthalungensis]
MVNVQYLEELLHVALTATVPNTKIPLLLVFHAVRLTLAYFALAHRGPAASRPSWLQGLISVLIVPLSGGIVTSILLTNAPPGWLASPYVVPTYAGVYLTLHIVKPIRDVLLSLPPLVVDLATLPADAILKTANMIGAGTELALIHKAAAVRANPWAPTIAGGLVGAAGYASLSLLDLFSPVWHISAPGVSGAEWDLYGPFVLSAVYAFSRGTNRTLNELLHLISFGKLASRRQIYLSADEARALVTLIQLVLQTVRSLGFWSLKLGNVSRRRLVATAKKNQ